MDLQLWIPAAQNIYNCNARNVQGVCTIVPIYLESRFIFSLSYTLS